MKRFALQSRRKFTNDACFLRGCTHRFNALVACCPLSLWLKGGLRHVRCNQLPAWAVSADDGAELNS